MNEHLKAFFSVLRAVECAAAGHADIVNWTYVRELLREEEKFITAAIMELALHPLTETIEEDPLAT